MEAPPLIDLLRDLRARIASAALTPGEAARALAAEARFDLTEQDARDLLARPVAEVEAEYVRTFDARRQQILNRPGARADLAAHVHGVQARNAHLTEQARRVLDRNGGDTVLASLELGFHLMQTYGLQDTDHAQEMARCLAVLLIERATPPAQGQEGR